jgi:hypothetical protein
MTKHAGDLVLSPTVAIFEFKHAHSSRNHTPPYPLP